jgi:anti-sigma-K factor RskA
MSVTQEQMAATLVRVEGMVEDISEIKDSMKVMAQAVNRLAVIEERQSTDRAEIGRAYKRLDNHEHRIRNLEQAQPLQKKTTEWVEKVFWSVIGAVISGVMALVIVKAQPPQAPAAATPVLVAPK